MPCNAQFKTPCDYVSRHTVTSKSAKCAKRTAPKKVVPSKVLAYCSAKAKSVSTGTIQTCKSPRQQCTKSDFTFNKTDRKEKDPIDFCKKCGDHINKQDKIASSDFDQAHGCKSIPSLKTSASKSRENRQVIQTYGKNVRVNGVKQYYRNENFQSTDSIQDAELEFKKLSLDTIKEVPDLSESGVNIYNVESDSEEVGFMDTSDADNISKIKKFREDNYFECHSAKSRLDYKASATKQRAHRCVYRFYLNDRLFPVPLSTDYNGTVRCVECHLPIDLKYDSFSNIPNGTIQAKVKINDGTQDLIMMLPVKKNLIIKERRKQIKKEDEVFYFGVIKLDSYGNSVFKSTLPSDSLALKYQKGYRQYSANENLEYKSVEDNDLIVI